MVREILQISVGQCGNQIGKMFWQNILEEHQIDNTGTFIGNDPRKIEKLNVYMTEVDTSKRKKKMTMSQIIDKNNKSLSSKSNPNYSGDKLIPQNTRFVPRAILLDLEPGVIDSIKASPMGSLFTPDSMINGISGAGNNWAKGHYVAGKEIIDEAMDCVRKGVEAADCLQGFQLTQALGGGTGSGFGTLVLNKLRDLYPDRISCTYSVYPAPKASDIVVEPYNALLSIHQLMETSDETFVIDNQSLFQISSKILKQNDPSYADLNWVISLIMSGVTASLRFSGLLNGDLRKMATNLIPFPRLHFFSCSFAPLFEKGKGAYTKWSYRQITEDIWRDDHFLADIHQEDGKYLSCCINYRGKAEDTSTYLIDNTIKELQMKNNEHFVSWIPHNIKTSMITVPPMNVPKCASLISNTTSIKSVFMRIGAQFGLLFQRRAFLHWYTAEGMDEMEFIDADQQIRDLIEEYQEKQDAIYMTPSPPSTDDERFEMRIKNKTEEEKVESYIQRKLKKLEKQMEREKKQREMEEKNKTKSVFGNIRNAKKQMPKRFKSKLKNRPNPGGFVETKSKKKTAIVWSDDEADELSEDLNEEYDDDDEKEQDNEEYHEQNGDYDEEEYDENAEDMNYDENGDEMMYDENGNYIDENIEYDEDGNVIEYDENGNIIEYEYDEDGNVIDYNAENEEYGDDEYNDDAMYDESLISKRKHETNDDEIKQQRSKEKEKKKRKKKSQKEKKRKRKKSKQHKEEEEEEKLDDDLDFLND